MAPSPFHAAIWLPRFALQVVQRAEASGLRGPAAVLDSAPEALTGKGPGCILHVNPLAAQAGVTPGMTPSQGLARCSRLILKHRLPREEERAHQEMLACAEAWTPRYESTQSGLCVLDLSRQREARLQSRECGQRLRAWFSKKALDARIGIAEKPDLACLAARAAEEVFVLDGRAGLDDTWRRLPVQALEPSPDLLNLLRLWGVATVEELAALPREGVAARLGEEGLRLWRLASGQAERLLRLVRPEAVYRRELELEHGLETVEPLLFLLRRLLESLCLRLAEEWLVAASQRLELRFEDGGIHACELRLAEATRDTDQLLRVCQTHLDGLTAPAPIVFISVELCPSRPLAKQEQLFERGLRDARRFADTLARIEAVLGTGRVGKPGLLPSRRVDAFAMADFLQPLPKEEDRPEVMGMPLRRFRPPHEVRVALDEGRPVSFTRQGAVLAIFQARGPWLLSGDWWDRQAWEREVWEIAASDGGLYQLAREGARWMLDGIFG